MLPYSSIVNAQQQKTRLLKAEDIAAMLGVKVQTVYTMARRGELEKVKCLGSAPASVPMRSSGSSRERLGFNT
jgi:hypothetical protein